MHSDVTPTEMPPLESSTEDEIATVLRSLTALAEDASSLSEFYPAVLASVADALQASWATVCGGVLAGRLTRVWSWESGEAGSKFQGQAGEELIQRIEEWLPSPECCLLLANHKFSRLGDLLIAPIVVEGTVVRVVVFGFNGPVPLDVHHGLKRFVTHLARAAERMEARSLVANVSMVQKGWDRYSSVVMAAGKDIPLPELARELVESGVGYTNSGRVALTLSKGKKQRLLAVSGIERYAKRAESVQVLEQLATLIVKEGQPLYCFGATDHLPPQIQVPLAHYLDIAAPKSLAIIPLSLRQTNRDCLRHLGTAIFERFEGLPIEESSDEILRYVALTESALARSTRLYSIPFLDQLLRIAFRSQWLGVGWMMRRLVLLAITLVGVAALFLVKADLTVEARGELIPQTVQHVFSPSDGLIKSVHTQHGNEIEENDLFVVITSSALTLRIEEEIGKIGVIREELKNIKTAAFGIAAGPDAQINQQELSARHKILELKLNNLDAQLNLLRDQEDSLQVKSPRAGVVVTWDIAKELANRPVRRGDLLGTVADLSGDWLLRLQVPDRLIGHVISVEKKDGKLPGLSFIVASDPEVAYKARSIRLGTSSQINSRNDGTFILLEADLIGPTYPELRLGALVKARIRCGHQPLYYVWFYEAYEEVRRFFF